MTDDLARQHGRTARQKADDDTAIEQALRAEYVRDVVRARRGGQVLALPAQDYDSVAGLLARPHNPDEDLPLWAVDQVQRRGQNGLLVSGYKIGKTTRVYDLARCLVDGEPWLDRYDTSVDGHVGIWNGEMSPSDDAVYWAPLGVRNADRIHVWHLRGYRLDLLNDYTAEVAVDWLLDNGVGYAIIDPWASLIAWAGLRSNDNDDAALLLTRLDQIKREAGVSELLVSAHTGRAAQEPGAEHVRGATRLDDWADVRWLLTKDADDVRYFRAHGRGVELPECALAFDELTGRSTLGTGDRTAVAQDRQVAEVVAIVTEHDGINSTGIQGQMQTSRTRSIQSAAIVRAEHESLIYSTRDGTSKRWHLVSQ